LLELEVFCAGHIKPKEKLACKICYIDKENARCGGYEPVSCLGHLDKNRSPGCITCSPQNMPSHCSYAVSLQRHPSIAYKRVIAQIPLTADRARKAKVPDSCVYLG
jgi:hypothetical protein